MSPAQRTPPLHRNRNKIQSIITSRVSSLPQTWTQNPPFTANVRPYPAAFHAPLPRASPSTSYRFANIHPTFHLCGSCMPVNLQQSFDPRIFLYRQSPIHKCSFFDRGGNIKILSLFSSTQNQVRIVIQPTKVNIARNLKSRLPWIVNDLYSEKHTITDKT